jgi:hypothetical protein
MIRFENSEMEFYQHGCLSFKIEQGIFNGDYYLCRQSKITWLEQTDPLSTISITGMKTQAFLILLSINNHSSMLTTLIFAVQCAHNIKKANETNRFKALIFMLDRDDCYSSSLSHAFDALFNGRIVRGRF